RGRGGLHGWPRARLSARGPRPPGASPRGHGAGVRHLSAFVGPREARLQHRSPPGAEPRELLPAARRDAAGFGARGRLRPGRHRDLAAVLGGSAYRARFGPARRRALPGHPQHRRRRPGGGRPLPLRADRALSLRAAARSRGETRGRRLTGTRSRSYSSASETLRQVLSGLKSFISAASFSVSFPRSFWKTTSSWLTTKVTTPVLRYSAGQATRAKPPSILPWMT